MAEHKSRRNTKRRWQSISLLLLVVLAFAAFIYCAGNTLASYKTSIRGRLLMPAAAMPRATVLLTPNEQMALGWENATGDTVPEGYSLEWAYADSSADPYANPNQRWLAKLGPGENAKAYAGYASTESAAEAAAASLEAAIAAAESAAASLEALEERSDEQSSELESRKAELTSLEEDLAGYRLRLERVNNRRMLLSVKNIGADSTEADGSTKSGEVSEVGLIYSIRIYSTGILPLEFVLRDEDGKLFYSSRTGTDTALRDKGYYWLYRFYEDTDWETKNEKPVLKESAAEDEFKQLTVWETKAGSAEKVRVAGEKKYQIFVGWDNDAENALSGSLRKELERLKVVVRLRNDPNEEQGFPSTAPTIEFENDPVSASLKYKDIYGYLDNM